MKTRTLLHAAGYAAAPKKRAFALKHPWKALSGWLAFRCLKRKMATPPAKRAMTAAGAAAATAVVAPLAMKAIKGHRKA